MKARYRIVHFIPDPFVGGRVPIAALVEHGAGRIDVARVPHIPGPNCLGGRAVSATVQIILEDLASVTHFDRLPASIGPQVALDRPWDVPRDVEDPVAWIQSRFFAQTTTVRQETEYRSPHRATFGYRFFETYGVSEYVKKTFHPGTDANGFLASASVLRPISHYVIGRDELLLMEPIVTRRPNWHEELSAIAINFGAYKTALLHERPTQKARLAAYVLAGASKGDLLTISSELTVFADDVIDTSDISSRTNFVTKIRDVGRSAQAKMFN